MREQGDVLGRRAHAVLCSLVQGIRRRLTSATLPANWMDSAALFQRRKVTWECSCMQAWALLPEWCHLYSRLAAVLVAGAPGVALPMGPWWHAYLHSFLHALHCGEVGAGER